ncbi:MAG: hypothetical protein U5R06_02630 [candidate division KSB1 bacterium]|nr:hypothetical protein [candidate division KSB1 bacterium]
MSNFSVSDLTTKGDHDKKTCTVYGNHFLCSGNPLRLVMKSKAEVSASMMGYEYSETIDDSDEALGVNVGGGLLFGSSSRSFTVYPLYNILFTEHENTEYFTLNVGISFLLNCF